MGDELIPSVNAVSIPPLRQVEYEPDGKFNLTTRAFVLAFENSVLASGNLNPVHSYYL